MMELWDNCLGRRTVLIRSEWTLRVCYVLTTAILVAFAPSECGACKFPSIWEGSWFQKGVQEPIRIYNGTISNKGVCRQVEGDKFLIESRTDRCFRCVVIHEKHINVLQYKETYCSTHHHSLEALCGEINGDALLFSMFRLNIPPVACPFHGPFTFTYSRGGIGVCSHPVSTVESCTVDSRLLFRFQACADVRGSESIVEELVCLANWKEGSTRYLVGKLEHKMAKTDEDKLRCFVYEVYKNLTGVLLAQSGDATCDGLLSPTEGSRTMKLTKASHAHAKCSFPDWMTTHKYWKTLDGRDSYEFRDHNNSFYIKNASHPDIERRVVCKQEEKSTKTSVQMVVHITSGCDSSYHCMRIHRRAGHVIEVQLGYKVADTNDACNSHNFDPYAAMFVTLTTSVPDLHMCPLMGIYTLEGSHPQLSPIMSPEITESQCSDRSTVTAGCDAHDRIEILAECSADRRLRAFQCHGSWEENGTHYLIASAVESRRRYCMVFTENERVLQLSGNHESCVRHLIYSRDFIIFNVTSRGVCSVSDDASLPQQNFWLAMSVLILSSLLNR